MREENDAGKIRTIPKNISKSWYYCQLFHNHISREFVEYIFFSRQEYAPALDWYFNWNRYAWFSYFVGGMLGGSHFGAKKTKLGHYLVSLQLDPRDKLKDYRVAENFGWGRTGFDHVNTPEAACRGRCVGLVNHSHQNKTANQELALAA